MTTPGKSNPYAAPQPIADPAARIAPGDFVIQDRNILCCDSIQLPPICLHTGRMENLEPRHKHVYWWNRTYSELVNAGPAVMCVLGAMVLNEYAIALAGLWILAVFARDILSTAVLRYLAAQPFTNVSEIRVDWFINKSYAAHQRRLRRTGMVLMVVLAPVIIMLLFSNQLSLNGFLLAVAVLSLLPLVLFMSAERGIHMQGINHRPPYAGTHQLIGAHRRFLDAVRARQQMGQ